MKEYSFNQLQDLVEEIYGENNPKKNLAINHLNFVSEDNDEFLRQIQMKFNVDFSSLPYNKYFDEDQFILLNLIKKILRYVGVLQKKPPLTLNHLNSVIKKGEWFNPDNNLTE